MMVRALRDIPSGEEVLMDYCSYAIYPEGRWVFLLDVAFTCRCPLCMQNADTTRAVGERRLHASQIARDAVTTSLTAGQIERLLREIEATYKPGDRFRDLLALHLMAYGQVLLDEWRYIQAFAAYDTALAIGPRGHLCQDFLIIVLQMRAYAWRNMMPELTQAFVQLLQLARGTMGLQWPELKLAAPRAVASFSARNRLQEIMECLYRTLSRNGAPVDINS
jgi:hypothetical protein